MPQTSIYYAMGRLSVLQQSTLDAAKIERLLQAPSVREAQRVLSEIGWPDSDDYEKSASEHVLRACRLIYEITTDPAIVDCFLYRYDVNNLKMLLKARCLGEEALSLSDCGTIPPEKLRQAVHDRAYAFLPKILAKTMDELEKRTAAKVDPLEIDVTLDKALYRMTFERLGTGDDTAVRYFRARVDCVNCIMCMRSAAAGRPLAFIRNLLLDGGTISAKKWLHAYENPDRLPLLMNAYGGKLYAAVLAAHVEPKKLTSLERAMDDYLLEIYLPYKRALDKPERLIGYLLLRQREAAAVRLIMAGKANAFPTEAIRERLRELYV